MNDETPEIESVEDVIETLVPGLSITDYEKIRSDALEKARNVRHAWRMKGRGKLICISCPIPHTSYIPNNITITGIDESSGNPILKVLD